MLLPLPRPLGLYLSAHLKRTWSAVSVWEDAESSWLTWEAGEGGRGPPDRLSLSCVLPRGEDAIVI